MMLHFPTTIIDNFLDEPNDFVNLAYSNKIKWDKDETGSWPGMRSPSLREIDYELCDWMMQKYLQIFWNNAEINMKANSFFQRIPSNVQSGWIHLDNVRNIHTFIIYLNPNPNPKSGTSLFTPKSNEAITYGDLDVKSKYYKGEISKEEENPSLLNHQSNFIEDIFVPNKFNRLFGFDGHSWHGVKNYDSNTQDDRLTLITFIEDLTTTRTPINRSKSFTLTRGNK